MDDREQRIVVMGEIAGSYGVRGWIKVKPYSNDPGALAGYATWWVDRGRSGDFAPMSLLEAREHGSLLVAHLDGIASREDASALAGARVGVPRSALPAPRADEVYQADLVGLDVVNRRGERLGRVAAVDEFGAHPVLRVAGDGTAERLIPFVPAYVERVDVAARRIDVDWEADY